MRTVRQPSSGGKASYGAPTDPRIIGRFWAKVQRSEGCWLWTASTARGYGQFCLTARGEKQVNVYAHRLSWMLAYGDIPDDLQVLHRCDTPLCVRPDHLFLGTQAENLEDARRKGRLIDGRGARKLSDDAYVAILTSAETNLALARRFGVHEMTISRIRNGRQGAASVQRILQDQTRQAELGREPADVLHQVLEPVAFRELPIVGEVR